MSAEACKWIFICTSSHAHELFNSCSPSRFSSTCSAAVKQYDDEVAAQEDTTSVFATKRFAVFRLCPSRTCEGIIQADEQDEEQANYNAQYQNNGQNYGDAE